VTCGSSSAPALTTGALEVPADESPSKSTKARSRVISQYWKLSKGKLTVWVAISALPGYFLALPGFVEIHALAALATGTFLTSASAQSMNQIMEVKRDALMKRTAMRPLPAGKLSLLEAKTFAAASGTVGLGILGVGLTPATAGVAALTMGTYILAYTPLKVITPYNTHVGAISGSLPVVLGFTAALGSGLVGSPWAGHAAWLFAMQSLWQMPHFYALAWLHRADYKLGGYSMFPLTDKTGHATAQMSKKYLVALCVLPSCASAMGLASWMLPVGAAVPCALWWRSLRAFEKAPSKVTCRRFFLDSLSYLLATLALFTAFARAEKPALQADAISVEPPSAHDDADATHTTFLEPAWRVALHQRFVELCPHELIKHDLFGIFESSCPFGKGSK